MKDTKSTTFSFPFLTSTFDQKTPISSPPLNNHPTKIYMYTCTTHIKHRDVFHVQRIVLSLLFNVSKDDLFVEYHQLQ